jgi:hypothetical protein
MSLALGASEWSALSQRNRPHHQLDRMLLGAKNLNSDPLTTTLTVLSQLHYTLEHCYGF